MRTALNVFLLLPLAALCACQEKADEARNDHSDGNVHVALQDTGGGKRVSVNVPGFDAKLTLPAFDLGKNVDLDGIRLAPQTVVKTIDVVGSDKDGGAGQGHVHIAFTSPYRPVRLLGYYRDTATHAGYKVAVDGATGLSANKGTRQFALSVTPLGDGSRGDITIDGS